MLKKKRRSQKGQALLEFALILTVLLMIVFLLIEASRIMWAWVTVQNAARSGARYAITGGFDPDCATNDIGKYAYLCEDIDGNGMDLNRRRPASIVKTAHDGLRGLKLNETGTLTDDYGYEIFVWGVDDEDPGDGVANGWRGSYMADPRGPDPYGGKPNMPVAVRVIYYVPIITPFFRPIRESIPVYGQTILNNEPFDQLGGTGRSAGAPPDIPELPTPGVTETFTPTPTPGDTETPSATPIPSSTATPSCPVRYTSSLVADSTFASVTGLWETGDTGNPYHIVTFYDITAGGDPDIPNSGPLVILGTTVMFEETGGNHACPGVGDTAPPNPLTSPLVGGHLIKAKNTDGTFDIAMVQQGTNTPTPTQTFTPAPTLSPQPTDTPEPTATPRDPYIDVLQSCFAAGDGRQINIFGDNWPPDEVISIYYDDVIQTQIQAHQHNGSFSRTLTVPVVDGQTHTVQVTASGGDEDTDTLVSPCPNITPTPVTATATPTDSPPDLIIVSEPILVSTPPIVGYNPVQFQVTISNTGDIDVNDQFFVDIYFDPAEVYSTTIPLQYSDGYLAIDSLSGGASRVITITAQTGFTGGASARSVYSMVDSSLAINETHEDNNISNSLAVSITPSTPTSTPTPGTPPPGYDTVSGVVRSFVESLGKWLPQHRARVYLQDENNPVYLIGPVESDQLGVYIFNNIPTGTTYTVYACLQGGASDYIGQRPVVSPPSFTANVNMFDDHISRCPVP
ncbi:MAG: hypothetical protein GY803_30355 [Chloroflexi bacterium]|nr:hypothetical protein [Chloroflexota bacterium]